MYFFVNLLPTLFGRKVSLGYKYSSIFFSGNMNFLHGFVFKCLHFQLILMIIILKKKLQVTAENFVYTNLGGKKEDSVVFLSFIQWFHESSLTILHSLATAGVCWGTLWNAQVKLWGFQERSISCVWEVS